MSVPSAGRVRARARSGRRARRRRAARRASPTSAPSGPSSSASTYPCGGCSTRAPARAPRVLDPALHDDAVAASCTTTGARTRDLCSSSPCEPALDRWEGVKGSRAGRLRRRLDAPLVLVARRTRSRRHRRRGGLRRARACRPAPSSPASSWSAATRQGRGRAAAALRRDVGLPILGWIPPQLSEQFVRQYGGGAGTLRQIGPQPARAAASSALPRGGDVSATARSAGGGRAARLPAGRPRRLLAPVPAAAGLRLAVAWGPPLRAARARERRRAAGARARARAAPRRARSRAAAGRRAACCWAASSTRSSCRVRRQRRAAGRARRRPSATACPRWRSAAAPCCCCAASPTAAVAATSSPGVLPAEAELLEWYDRPRYVRAARHAATPTTRAKRALRALRSRVPRARAGVVRLSGGEPGERRRRPRASPSGAAWPRRCTLAARACPAWRRASSPPCGWPARGPREPPAALESWLPPAARPGSTLWLASAPGRGRRSPRCSCSARHARRRRRCPRLQDPLLRDGQSVFWDNYWYGGGYGALTYGFVYYWLAAVVPGAAARRRRRRAAARPLLPLPARHVGDRRRLAGWALRAGHGAVPRQRSGPVRARAGAHHGRPRPARPRAGRSGRRSRSRSACSPTRWRRWWSAFWWRTSSCGRRSGDGTCGSPSRSRRSSSPGSSSAWRSPSRVYLNQSAAAQVHRLRPRRRGAGRLTPRTRAGRSRVFLVYAALSVRLVRHAGQPAGQQRRPLLLSLGRRSSSAAAPAAATPVRVGGSPSSPSCCSPTCS